MGYHRKHNTPYFFVKSMYVTEKILHFNEILDFIEQNNNNPKIDTNQNYKFCRLTAQTKDHFKRQISITKGSTHNILVERKTGGTLLIIPLN
jgi:hypothetical protein